MRFVYQYRTSDNVPHSGTIVAANREAAFQALKVQGIRPGKLDEASGLFNRLFGKGKRWITIGVLTIVLVITVVALLKTHQSLTAAQDELKYAAEDRAQLFGDPFVLKKLSTNGWRNTFPNEGDAWFARHAQPGIVENGETGQTAPAQSDRTDLSDKTVHLSTVRLAIADADSDELKKMKRMINCMKAELQEYLVEGGTQEQYVNACDERQRVERNIYESALSETKNLEARLDKGEDREKIESQWNKRNELLRSMGLMTIPFPE